MDGHQIRLQWHVFFLVNALKNPISLPSIFLNKILRHFLVGTKLFSCLFLTGTATRQQALDTYGLPFIKYVLYAKKILATTFDCSCYSLFPWWWYKKLVKYFFICLDTELWVNDTWLLSFFCPFFAFDTVLMLFSSIFWGIYVHHYYSSKNSLNKVRK